MCLIPYFRLLYNKLNTFNYKNALYINIIEKLICGIIFYIIITNNFDLDNILRYIDNKHNTYMTNNENNNLNMENTINKNNNDILLNNFKKIFAK